MNGFRLWISEPISKKEKLPKLCKCMLSKNNCLNNLWRNGPNWVWDDVWYTMYNITLVMHLENYYHGHSNKEMFYTFVIIEHSKFNNVLIIALQRTWYKRFYREKVRKVKVTSWNNLYTRNLWFNVRNIWEIFWKL